MSGSRSNWLLCFVFPASSAGGYFQFADGPCGCHSDVSSEGDELVDSFLFREVESESAGDLGVVKGEHYPVVVHPNRLFLIIRNVTGSHRNIITRTGTIAHKGRISSASSTEETITMVRNPITHQEKRIVISLKVTGRVLVSFDSGVTRGVYGRVDGFVNTPFRGSWEQGAWLHSPPRLSLGAE